MVVQEEDVILGGPKAAATLDEIANAAESTRPPENDMFSPRSSAAMTLTSIALQAHPQQALFTQSSASANDLQKSLSNDVDFPDDEDDEDYFLDAKQAFQPPRETFLQRSSKSQVRTLSDTSSKHPASAKIRRISVGNHPINADENAPAFRVSENRMEPSIPSSSSKDSYNPMPFSSSHSYGPNVLVNSYTIGPCAFSVTRPNPPPATPADFLPPPWTNQWGTERPVYPSLAPQTYSAPPNQWDRHHPHGPQSRHYNPVRFTNDFRTKLTIG